MELVQIKGDTWCLEGDELIGVYRLDGRRCILIDSGWVREREALREAIQREGLLPVGAIATHAHRDHVGNHRWLQSTYGTKTCLSAGEAAVMVFPGLCKGLYSVLSLEAILAELGPDFPFQPDQIVHPGEDTVEFLGVPFRIHHTPGHSADHICVGTPDGVCHVGDLVLSEQVARAARMPYHQIQRLARESMQAMRGVSGYSHYLVAHRGVTQELAPLVDLNLASLDRANAQILSEIDGTMSWNDLVALTRGSRSKDGGLLWPAIYENCLSSFVEALWDLGKLDVYYDENGVRRYRRSDRSGTGE